MEATTEKAARKEQETGVKTEIRAGAEHEYLATGPSKHQIRRLCVKEGYQPRGPYQRSNGSFECPVFRKRTAKELREHRLARARRRGISLPQRRAS